MVNIASSVSGTMQQTSAKGISLSRRWTGPLLVLVVAATLRVLHLYQIRGTPFFAHPIIDAWDYHNDALNILRTGDWVGSRVFFQAPLATYLYAIVYRIAGENPLWPRIVQMVIGCFSALGMFMLGRRLFSERAAWIAGMVAAVYPLCIFFEGELLAPAITMFLDVLFFLVFFGVLALRLSWRWPVSGFLLGLRALATTNILAAVPVFWVWIAIKERTWNRPGKRRALAAAMFTLGVALAVAPVAYRNLMLSRELVPVSSNAGINFYIGNSGDYDAKVAIRDGADWEDFVNRHVREGGEVGPRMSGYFFRKAWEYIRSDPEGYARLLAYKVGLFLRGDEIMRNQAIYPFREYSGVLRLLMWKVGSPGKPGLAVPFGILLPLTLPGCLLVIRQRSRAGVLLLVYGTVYSLSVIAFFITARYRLPVVLPAILLLAYGWAGVRIWWSDRLLRSLALAGMAILFFISNWSVGPMAKEMNADAYYNLGNTLVYQGDIYGAQRAYRRAIEMNPRDVAAWVNLGLHVYQERGELDRAADCYIQALKVRPGYATAVFNLGFLAEQTNRPALAESLYLEAADLDPLMSGAYINLAGMALSRGAFGEALEYYRQAHMRDRDNPAALIGLGVATSELEGLEPALEFFEEAIRIDPSDPDVFFNLSLAYLRAGRFGRAAEAARKAVDLDPSCDDVYLVYADAMRSAGRAEEALAFLREAIRYHPDRPGPRRALRRLGE